ncbi:MAG: hypothetical protein ACREJM_07895 [Candidatus Saccharimonadales bacterium]
MLHRERGRGRLLILGEAVVHVTSAELVGLAKQTGFALADCPTTMDPFTLGRALGFTQTDTLDINGRASITTNLHDPVPDALLGRYDCLIDAGVLFWCFDPAAALANILCMVRPGGLIIHITAVSGYYGRGYYNIHPLLLEDFYLSNTCELVLSTFRTKFQVRPGLRRLLKVLGVRNMVTHTRQRGNVYLKAGRFNRVAFGDHYPAPVEPNVLPNNIVGVFVFRRLADGPVQYPVRTAPFDRRDPRGGVSTWLARPTLE